MVTAIMERGRAEWAYAVLKSAITNGLLKPGEHLGEIAIASQLGVSRAPVREAITRLQAGGLVAQESNGRAIVRSFGLEEIKEVLFVRRILEMAAIELACDLDIADRGVRLAELRTILQQVRTAEPSRQYELNISFHLGLIELAGNQHLKKTVLGNLDQLQVALAASPHRADNLASSHSQHRQLFAAVEAGDVSLARNVMHEHLMATELNIERSHSAQGGRPSNALKIWAQEMSDSSD